MQLAVDGKPMILMPLPKELPSTDLVIIARHAAMRSKHPNRVRDHAKSVHRCAREYRNRISIHVGPPKRIIPYCLFPAHPIATLRQRKSLHVLHHHAQRSLQLKPSFCPFPELSDQLQAHPDLARRLGDKHVLPRAWLAYPCTDSDVVPDLSDCKTDAEFTFRPSVRSTNTLPHVTGLQIRHSHICLANFEVNDRTLLDPVRDSGVEKHLLGVGYDVARAP